MKRKMAKKLLGGLLAAILLVGCGQEAADTAGSAAAGGESAAEETAASTAAAETKEASDAAASGEVVTINYVRPGTEVEHNDELVAAINEKLEADGTGLQLEITYVPSDVFSDRVNMMLSAGEEFDLLAVMEDQKSFTTYIGTEGIQPITEYVKNSEVLQEVIPAWMWQHLKGSICALS